MKHGSEILSIIEAGLEGNKKKAFAYAELLFNKLDDSDTLKKAIGRRLSGEYKNDPVLNAIKLKKG